MEYEGTQVMNTFKIGWMQDVFLLKMAKSSFKEDPKEWNSETRLACENSSKNGPRNKKSEPLLGKNRFVNGTMTWRLAILFSGFLCFKNTGD